jgi:hypothetical protein
MWFALRNAGSKVALMLPPGSKITSEMLWLGTLIFAAIDAVFVPFLAWRTNPETFRRFKWALVASTTIFWSAL